MAAALWGGTDAGIRQAAATPVAAPGGAAVGSGATGGAGNLAVNVATGNIAALPQNTELADAINARNRAAQQAANEARLGASGAAIQNQLLTNTAANARGEVGQDILDQLAMRGAERGVGFSPDSPNANAAVMRALGLTSQGLQSQAGIDYSRLLAENPGAPIFGMQDLLVSPGVYSSAEQAELARQQQQAQFEKEMEFRYYAANQGLFSDALRAGYGAGRNVSPVGYGGGGGYPSVAQPTLPTTGIGTSPTYPSGTYTPTATATAPAYNPYNPLDPTGSFGLGDIPSFGSGGYNPGYTNPYVYEEPDPGWWSDPGYGYEY